MSPWQHNCSTGKGFDGCVPGYLSAYFRSPPNAHALDLVVMRTAGNCQFVLYVGTGWFPNIGVSATIRSAVFSVVTVPPAVRYFPDRAPPRGALPAARTWSCPCLAGA